MTVAREEIFGSVLCVITYETDEDAIRIANDTSYGSSRIRGFAQRKGKRTQKAQNRTQEAQKPIPKPDFLCLLCLFCASCVPSVPVGQSAYPTIATNGDVARTARRTGSLKFIFAIASAIPPAVQVRSPALLKMKVLSPSSDGLFFMPRGGHQSHR